MTAKNFVVTEKTEICGCCDGTGILTINYREMETGKDYSIDYICFGCGTGEKIQIDAENAAMDAYERKVG
jgi:hypothetical protein